MRKTILAVAMVLAALLPLEARKKTTHTVMSANIRITGLPADGRPGSGRRIDFIFGRGDLKTVAAEVVKDHPGGIWPSDHYFVCAEFAVGE